MFKEQIPDKQLYRHIRVGFRGSHSEMEKSEPAHATGSKELRAAVHLPR